MTATTAIWIGLAVAASSPSLAQGAPSAASPRQGFGSLWTGWSNVSRESIRMEAEAARRNATTADANEARALGERVGEVVRLGDCEAGERIAREAGDFALVDAVRAHCRQAESRSGSPQDGR